MPPIIRQRITTSNEEDIVVFLIGMRINKVWKLHRWVPVGLAMGRMLKELYQQPQLGLLHHEAWAGRTAILVQYWASMDQLMDYARNRNAEHLPAWADFNRKIGSNGDVGIWHETYVVPSRRYETVYNNMPPFGLAKALGHEPAKGSMKSALARLDKSDGSEMPVDVAGQILNHQDAPPTAHGES